MRVSGDYLSGWCSAVIQAVAMHENWLPISKCQHVSQPVGTRSLSSGPVSCGPAIMWPRPTGTCARGHWDADLPGSRWALSLPMGLDLMSHSGLQLMEARNKHQSFC